MPLSLTTLRLETLDRDQYRAETGSAFESGVAPRGKPTENKPMVPRARFSTSETYPSVVLLELIDSLGVKSNRTPVRLEEVIAWGPIGLPRLFL